MDAHYYEIEKLRSIARRWKRRAEAAEQAAQESAQQLDEFADQVNEMITDPESLAQLLDETGVLDDLPADDDQADDGQDVGDDAHDDAHDDDEPAAELAPEPPPAPRLPTAAALRAAIANNTPITIPKSLSRNDHAWIYETRNEIPQAVRNGLVTYTDDE